MLNAEHNYLDRSDCTIVYLVLHLLSTQHINDLVKQRGSEDVPVDQQSFHGIACGRVVTLGIPD